MRTRPNHPEHEGKFVGVELLDHLGDAYEALEEMYGMIHFLAGGDLGKVEIARLFYKEGIKMSPGVWPHGEPFPKGPYDD